MKKTVCDFCGRDVDSAGIRFTHKENRYRIDISVFGTGRGNGIRTSRTDACPKCTIRYVIKAAKNMLKEYKKHEAHRRNRSRA
jgi:DNA-directed RNA polymerase subunit RPC12/RpoP